MCPFPFRFRTLDYLLQFKSLACRDGRAVPNEHRVTHLQHYTRVIGIFTVMRNKIHTPFSASCVRYFLLLSIRWREQSGES